LSEAGTNAGCSQEWPPHGLSSGFICMTKAL
jgi:hypothetical protein